MSNLHRINQSEDIAFSSVEVYLGKIMSMKGIHMLVSTQRLLLLGLSMISESILNEVS